MAQLPYEVWSYVLDEANEVDDSELWLSTRCVCRLFNEAIKQHFRRFLYLQIQCEVRISFVEWGRKSSDWASLPKNEVFRPVIGDDDIKVLEKLPEAVFGAEGKREDRLVWLVDQSRCPNQRPADLVARPDGVKYTPSPDAYYNPFGQALSSTSHFMFHPVDLERRIYRPWKNIMAERGGQDYSMQDDWYLLMEEEESEEGNVLVGRALTVPFAYLVRFVFEQLFAEDATGEEQVEELKRRRLR
jgi:hypothetical protein